MSYKIFLLLFSLLSFMYSQCIDYLELDCNNNENCDWIEDITTMNCSNFNGSSSCESYSNYGCSWEFSWGGWQNYGSSCVGGSFQIDNSYCQEIEMPECSEMMESVCASNSGCEWIEDIELENCYFAWSESNCQAHDGCEWECEMIWDSSLWQDVLVCDCEGQYQVDNGYCQEISVQECSEIESESDCNSSEQCNWVEGQVNCNNLENELQCSYNNCDWIEDYEWSACSNYNSASECSWANANGGNCDWSWNSTQWQDTCSGGSFQLDTSYCFGDSSFCEEINYFLGDINNDSNINIQDVIQVVNLILNQEYNNIADMNNDQIINIIDVIQIIDVILNGEA